MSENIAVVFLIVALLIVALVAWSDSTMNERFADDPNALVEGACVVHLLDGNIGIVAQNNSDPFSLRFGVRFGSMEHWRYYNRREFRRCTDEESFE